MFTLSIVLLVVMSVNGNAWPKPEDMEHFRPCVHEAGHSLAYHLNKDGTNITLMTVVPGPGYNGRTDAIARRTYTLPQMKAYLQYMFGGIYAEQVFLYNFDSDGFMGDMNQAEIIAQIIAYNLEQLQQPDAQYARPNPAATRQPHIIKRVEELFAEAQRTVMMVVLNTLPMSTSAGAADEMSSSSSPIRAQPSILVLCKRALHCVTHGGNPRFTIRLQTVALCLTVLSHWKDAHIPLCIGTGTKTVLFYSDTRLIWSGQLSFAAQHIGTCTFNESLRSMLALLSDEGNLFIGYLGTEPSLFRMPATESRFIDFEARKKELRQFEEIIWRCSKQSNEGDQQQGIDVQVTLDNHSASFNAVEGVPSATLTVSVPDSAAHEDQGVAAATTTHVPSATTMCLKSELFCVQGNQWTTTMSKKSVPFSAQIFCHERPVFDPRCQLCMLSSTGIRFANFCVPLSLICREAANAQRHANFKISLDSNKTALDLSTLFPEFVQTNEKTSLALQPFCGNNNNNDDQQQQQKLIVSLFVSAKMNRYRIQSDSCDFLYAILSTLVERIQQLQPDVQLRCPIPMHLFLGEIAKFIEAENLFEQLEKEACRVSVQMRQVETLFLSAAKSGDAKQNQLANIRTLLNYSHGELANALDKIANVQQLLYHGGRHSLRALLNLMHVLFTLNGLNLPFDGTVLDGTDQRLSERIAQLLSPCAAGAEAVGDLNGAEIGRMLADLLEKDGDGSGGKLGGIAEEDEEEEEEEAEEDNAQREERERKELQEVIANAERSLGLAQLRSGSLPAKHLDGQIR